ncbi:hypothetical protein GCM10009839_59150 [Catenulispora yoronensis]|uniref:Uncharacterized protein n=1 Tax=Catenulispora yoronensis TaxID=450799 RepID=A0ABN2UZG6_9ACTN
MTSQNRSRLGIGDGVVRGGQRFTVVGVSGTTVLLADRAGKVEKTALAVLLAEDGFAFTDMPGPKPVPALGSLEGLPPEVIERARWWERHILDVLNVGAAAGIPPLGAREAA